jgi:hypothetical protein
MNLRDLPEYITNIKTKTQKTSREEKKKEISSEFVDEMRGNLNFPQRFDRTFNYHKWNEIYKRCNEHNIDGLINRIRKREVRQGLKAYKYYYNSNYDVSNLFIIRNKNGRNLEDRIIAGIEKTFDNIDPVIAALITGWVSAIEIDDIPSNGVYEREEKKIKIDTYEIRTICHELAHAIQDIMAVQSYGFIDNRNLPKPLRFDFLQKNYVVKTNTEQENLRTDISDVWKRYNIIREDSHIREYQNKNINEFVAVGFETWILDRKQLKKKQPLLCDLFDKYFRRVQK